jgi:hypothetical protein
MDKIFRLIGVGVAVGATVAVFGPPLLKAARPLIRQGLKAGMIGYERGREALVHLTETVEDAYAEAVAELTAEAFEEEAEAAAESPTSSPTNANG